MTPSPSVAGIICGSSSHAGKRVGTALMLNPARLRARTARSSSVRRFPFGLVSKSRRAALRRCLEGRERNRRHPERVFLIHQERTDDDDDERTNADRQTFLG